MISKELFCERLLAIQAADKKLHEAIEAVFEKNPFLDSRESSAFPAEWVYNITEDHLKTLFIAVNDKIAASKVIKDWDKAIKDYEEKVEELRKAGIDAFSKGVYRPDETDCERTVLQAEVDYYYAESGFGGEVEMDGRKFNLNNPEHLYEYLKLLK